MITLQESQPPVVRFDYVPVEDRNKSLEEGRKVYNDVAYVFVRQRGCRDEVEKVATEWLSQKKRAAMEGSYSREWYQHHERMFEEWKKGNEIPDLGTPLRMIAFLKPSEIQNWSQMGIRTVEDLAAASEEAIARFGMGGRDNKYKAQQYLQAADKTGKGAARIESLEAENNALKERLSALEEAMAMQPKRGRPPKQENV